MKKFNARFNVFQGRDNFWYFTVNSWLKAQHGPFDTYEQAKTAAEAYVKDF